VIVALIPWLLTTGGAVFAISVLSVHYRDMRDLVGHLLNLLFFSSPIIYSLEGLQVPVVLHRVLTLNPLASLVTLYRDAVFAGRVSSPQLWLIAFAVGIVSWWLGTRVFAAYRETVVEAV
jgi:teichoic acid transport system permease protein